MATLSLAHSKLLVDIYRDAIFLKAHRLEVGLELQCRPLRLADWRLGAERDSSPVSKDWQVWFGPFLLTASFAA